MITSAEKMRFGRVKEAKTWSWLLKELWINICMVWFLISPFLADFKSTIMHIIDQFLKQKVILERNNI